MSTLSAASMRPFIDASKSSICRRGERADTRSIIWLTISGPLMLDSSAVRSYVIVRYRFIRYGDTIELAAVHAVKLYAV